MKTKTKLLFSAVGLAALASVAVAGSSLAQDGGRHGSQDGPGFHKMGYHMPGRQVAWRHGDGFRGHKHHRMGLRLLERYDANGDGRLSQDEIDQGRSERLAQFDTDKDGKLSLAEFQALWLDAMRERMVDRFQDFDDDGDGLVTGDEYDKPFKHMIERFDRNGDGVLGFDDRRPHHEGPARDDKDD